MKHYAMGARPRKWAKLWLVLLILSILVVGVTVVIFQRSYNQQLRPASASQRAVLVTIPQGATVQEIATKLHAQGLIRASWAFKWYVRNHNLRTRLQAGTYSLRPNQSVQDIIDILTHGRVATDLVTILPGQRLDQIREALINNAGFSAEEVDKALDPAQYATHPALADKPSGVNLEGYLYPDSYQKTADTKPETIIKAALDEMQKYLTTELRAAIAKQGLNIHQGVILASIIEQEVSNPKDKFTVAQVFLTRLRQNMPLQSDPTAVYGAIKAGQTLSLGESLSYDSPYNTYLHADLPPGPISNVSVASLQAVANPATTNYLYFVAGDDGVTYFSRTTQEHQALTAQHCKKLCQ